MGDARDFYYEPDEAEELRTEVVTAVAKAHDKDVLDQKWLISEDIKTDALNGLFQEHNLKMILQFEVDSTTTIIIADKSGNPVIEAESHS